MDDPIAQEMAALKDTLIAVTAVADPCPELGLVTHLAARLVAKMPQLKLKWEKLTGLRRDERARVVKEDIRDLLLHLGAETDNPDRVAAWGISQCDALFEVVSNNLHFLASTSYVLYVSGLEQIVKQVYDGGHHSRMLTYMGEFARSSDMKAIGQFHANMSVEYLRWLNQGLRPLDYPTVARLLDIYLRYAGIYEKDLLFLQGLIETVAGNRPTYQHLVSQRHDADGLVNYMKRSRLPAFANPWDTLVRNTDAHTGFYLDLASATVFIGDRGLAKPYQYAEVWSLTTEMAAVVLACRLLPCVISRHNWVHFQEIAGGA